MYKIRNLHQLDVDEGNYLFCNEQHDAFKQLVPIQSGDSHVQEQTIQHRGGNIGQVVQDQQGQTNQNVGEDGRQSSLPHTHNTAKIESHSILHVMQGFPIFIIYYKTYMW